MLRTLKIFVNYHSLEASRIRSAGEQDLSTGHSENKILTSVSKPDNEVRPIIIEAVILSVKILQAGPASCAVPLTEGGKLGLQNY